MADPDAENWLKDMLGPEVEEALAFSNPDELVDYQQIALALVTDIVTKRFKDAKVREMPEFSVYVVWFSKTLQNFKALLSTSIPDGAYYEVTYDGDKGVAYVDSYKKFDQNTFQIKANPGYLLKAATE